MSRKTYKIKIDDEIIPVHVIEANLSKIDVYNRRKTLRGEYTARGVIKSGSVTSGTISFRLTNRTAPLLLYLITGWETEYSHVPETRKLYKRTLEINYYGRPEFSLIEISADSCIEISGIKASGFTISQENESPLKLEIQAITTNEPTTVIEPETDTYNYEPFFYLYKPMMIKAEYNRNIFNIDTTEMITEKPFLIEAYSREEYESNRAGKFGIEIEEYQFEGILKSNGSYSNSCYGKPVFNTYISNSHSKKVIYC